MIFEVYKLSVLQFLSSRVELVKGLLFLGTAVWWKILGQLAADTQASSSWSPLNLLVLKTLLGTRLSPQGCYKAECSALESFKCLSSGPNKPQLTLTVWEQHSQSRVVLMNLKECYQSIS